MQIIRDTARNRGALLTGAFVLCAAALIGATLPLALSGCGSGTPDPPVVITPDAVTLAVSGTQTFTPRVTRVANQSVTWSIQEGGGGTITSSGAYTAPATTGIFHIVATSAFTPSWTAVATVIVTRTVPTPSPSVSASPI